MEKHQMTKEERGWLASRLMLLKRARLSLRTRTNSRKIFQRFVFAFILHFRINRGRIQAIHRYLKKSKDKDCQTEAERKAKVKPKKVKQFYTIRDVVKDKYKSLIADQIPYESTHPKYIGRFQAAVTKVLNDLTEEDLEEAEKTLEEWNTEGAPSDVQVK
jgi:hypothetical protein